MATKQLNTLLWAVVYCIIPGLLLTGSALAESSNVTEASIFIGTDPFPDAFSMILRGIRSIALIVLLAWAIPLLLRARPPADLENVDLTLIANLAAKRRKIAQLCIVLGMVMLFAWGIELSVYGLLPPIFAAIWCHPIFWVVAIAAALYAVFWGGTSSACTLTHTFTDTSTKTGSGVVTLNLNIVATAASSLAHPMPMQSTYIYDIWYTTSGSPSLAVTMGNATSLRSTIFTGITFTHTPGAGIVTFTGTLVPSPSGGMRMQVGDSIVIRAQTIDANYDIGHTDHVITL